MVRAPYPEEHGTRRLALGAAVIISGLLAASCACTQYVHLVDDFEGCTETCGWAVSGPGTAAVVSTILEGEHGLRIDGGVTVSKSIAEVDAGLVSTLHLVADCPAGLVAILSITVPGSPDLSLTVPLAIDTAPTSSADTLDFTGVSYLPLFGPITLPSGVSATAVHLVTLRANPGATCTVDVIQLLGLSECLA